MNFSWNIKRWTAGALAAALTLGLGLPARAAEKEETEVPAGGETAGAEILSVTTGSYTYPAAEQAEDARIQAGGLYTLIALPLDAAKNAAKKLNLAEGTVNGAVLKEAMAGNTALYVGFATAEEAGRVTFHDVRLRAAVAVDYFITGPELDTPVKETSGAYINLSGSVGTAAVEGGDKSATVTLVDVDTGYRYSPSAQASTTTGGYAFWGIAPGEYLVKVEKKGYLPYTRKGNVVVGQENKVLAEMDLREYVGDVNDDGKRDKSDLTTLLGQIGKTNSEIPAGIYADLNGDGTVDAKDVALLVERLVADKVLTTGTGDATGAKITLTDEKVSGDLRKVTVSLMDGEAASGAVVTAGAVALRFRADQIQPTNATGGAISPANGGTVANGLVAENNGLTISDKLWTIEENTITLSFLLEGSATGKLVSFYYKPKAGVDPETDYYDKTFVLSQAAILAGKNTLVMDVERKYANANVSRVKSIQIDTPDYPGTAGELTLPEQGKTTVLPVSATGYEKENLEGTAHKNLTGVDWSVWRETDNGEEKAEGITVEGGLLTITDQAKPGEIFLYAERDGVKSEKLELTLKEAERVVTTIRLLRGSKIITTADRVELDDQGGSVTYTAKALDQYGKEMENAGLNWSLSGAPEGVTVANGILSTSGVAAGKYSFKLHLSGGVGAATASMAATVQLTVQPTLKALVLTGPGTVAKPGAGERVSLSYTVTALDGAGQSYPMEGGAALSIAAKEENGSTEGITVYVDNVTGQGTVTLTETAAEGTYLLTAEYKEKSGTMELRVLTGGEGSHAAVENREGARLSTLQVTRETGTEGRESLTALVVDRDGNALDTQPEFNWFLKGAPTGFSMDGNTLVIANTVTAGSYAFRIQAKSAGAEGGVSYEVEIPAEVTVKSTLAGLTLSAPVSELEIPAEGKRSYALKLVGTDRLGHGMELPEGIGYIILDEDQDPASGVSVDSQGNLTLSADAKVGKITVEATYLLPATDEEMEQGGIVRSNRLELTLTAKESVKLMLYRGKTAMQEETDRENVRVGKAAELNYAAYWYDTTTGTATAATDVKWINDRNGFSVSADTEWGVYSAPVTAVCARDGKNYTASVTAVIAVYPNITELEWQQTQALEFPVGTPKTYRGQVMAVTNTKERIPINQLIEGYDFTYETPFTGMRLSYDEETNELKLVVDLNAKDAYEDVPKAERYLLLALDYDPNSTETVLTLHPMNFSTETSKAQNAILRLGTGKGSSFVFSTAHSGADYSVSKGTLSYVFALELLDQYSKPMKNAKAKITLENQDGSTPVGIELLSGSSIQAITDTYSSYATMGRLRVTDKATAGEHRLRLNITPGVKTGNAAYFEPFTVDFTLKVEELDQAATLKVTGEEWVEAPIYYTQFASTNVNTKSVTAGYTALLDLQEKHQELDMDGYSISWKLEDANDGVSLSYSGTYATLTVAPGAEANSAMKVTAAMTRGDSRVTGEQKVVIYRSSSIPTVIRVKDGNRYVTNLGTLKVEKEEAESFGPYTFEFYDQYGDRVSDSVAQKVQWRLRVKNGSNYSEAPSGVSVSSEKGTSTKIQVSDTAAEMTRSMVLSAYYGVIPTATVKNDRFVFQDVPFTLQVGSSSGGGGGGLGGGDETEEEEIQPSPSPVPEVGDNVTVVPTVSQSGSTGKVSLTEEQENALKYGGGSAVTIAPAGGNGLTNLTVTISQEAITAVAEKKQTLTVQTALGTVKLDSKAVSGLAGGSGSSVSITVTGSGNNFSVVFKSGNRTLETLNGTVKISLVGSGTVVYEVKNGISTLLPKMVVENGTIMGTVNGSIELKTATPTADYADTRNHWAKEAIEFVSGRELFQGTGGNQFSPDLEMSRGMIVTVLHRLEQSPAAALTAAFDDVELGSWYADGVSWANARGIVQGSNGSFDPNGTLTREQLATILYRYAQVMGISTAGSGNLSRFQDGGRTSTWAQTAMKWCVAKGLINGKSGNLLDPQGSASRGEVATTLKRLITLMAQA